MKDQLKNLLFAHHILVSDGNTPQSYEDVLGILVTLGQKWGIRVTEGWSKAVPSMMYVAERCLGDYVPAPFYTGFPKTVRNLTPDQLLYDQLLHYVTTYGLGHFEEPGHSVFEEEFERVAFAEKTELKDFRILAEEDAEKELFVIFKNMLSGTRPLSNENLSLVCCGWEEYKNLILPQKIPCKLTCLQLFYFTNGYSAFVHGLKMADVIKYLSWIQYYVYGSEDVTKLNLRNKDRKLITHLIDILLSNATEKDFRECWEKKRIWCGLLHHIHYHPTNPDGEYFVDQIRNGKPRSLWSTVGRLMSEGHPAFAAKLILRVKGPAALARNLDYILSRCTNEKQIQEVLSCLH